MQRTAAAVRRRTRTLRRRSATPAAFGSRMSLSVHTGADVAAGGQSWSRFFGHPEEGFRCSGSHHHSLEAGR